MYATEKRHFEIVKFLVENGAIVEAKDVKSHIDIINSFYR